MLSTPIVKNEIDANNINDYEKCDIENADILRCYNIVKTLSLKRYKIKDNLPIQKKDRHQIGWLIDDIQTVFPKSINSLDYGELIYNDNNTINNIIKNYKVGKTNQIIPAMYGSLQKIIQDKERLEQQIQEQTSTISTLQNQLSQLTTWATNEGYIPPQ